MLEIDVEGGEVIYSQTVYLGNVVFVACQSARRGSSGQRDMLDKSKNISTSVCVQLS